MTTEAEAAEGGLRPIRPLALPGIEPEPVAGGMPVLREVAPTALLVDDSYQRGLSERSIDLIRRIVYRWDWRRFKPPVVAEGPQGLEVIDGQHTAIAAASHPEISVIPVMVVEAAQRSERAMAFIGQNRDRLGITMMQLHFAALTAGDPEAQTVDQVCRRAGVTILRSTPGNGVWSPGQTVAVNAITALCGRRGAMKARQVLEVLANAKCAPVGALQIKAVDTLLHDPEYAGQVAAEDITSALLKLGGGADSDARVFAAAHNVPIWKALAVILFRRSRGRRRPD